MIDVKELHREIDEISESKVTLSSEIHDQQEILRKNKEAVTDVEMDMQMKFSTGEVVAKNAEARKAHIYKASKPLLETSNLIVAKVSKLKQDLANKQERMDAIKYKIRIFDTETNLRVSENYMAIAKIKNQNLQLITGAKIINGTLGDTLVD